MECREFLQVAEVLQTPIVPLHLREGEAKRCEVSESAQVHQARVGNIPLYAERREVLQPGQVFQAGVGNVAATASGNAQRCEVLQPGKVLQPPVVHLAIVHSQRRELGETAQPLKSCVGDFRAAEVQAGEMLKVG